MDLGLFCSGWVPEFEILELEWALLFVWWNKYYPKALFRIGTDLSFVISRQAISCDSLLDWIVHQTRPQKQGFLFHPGNYTKGTNYEHTFNAITTKGIIVYVWDTFVIMELPLEQLTHFPTEWRVYFWARQIDSCNKQRVASKYLPEKILLPI